MSAKAREEVICFCGQKKLLLKNLKNHHKNKHINQQQKYTLVQPANQQTFSFEPPTKISKQDMQEEEEDTQDNSTQSPNADLEQFSKDELEHHQLETLISGVSNISDLKFYTKNILHVNDDDNFVCTTCKHEFRVSGGQDEKDRTRKLRNLKMCIKRHLKSDTHVSNVQQFRADNIAYQNDMKLAESAALHCAQAAYLCFKQDTSYDSYPYMIKFAFDCGGSVGTIMHSRKFPLLFLPSVSNVIRKTLCNFVKEKPFGMMADKITSLGRVRHIFGLRIPQLDDTNSDVCAVDLYLSHSVVKDATAIGLATHLLQSLEMFGLDKVEIRKCLAGVAFDGQYILLNVCAAIKKELHIKFDVPESWDPMHNVELAHTRAETEIVRSTCETINSVMKTVKHGKQLEILLTYAELCDTFYKPKIFKDMKFISHSQSVFSTFYHDFSAIIATFAETENDLLENILVPDFIMNFLFLQEIINLLGNMSKSFQKSNQLPHDYPRKFFVFMANLEQKTEELEKVLNAMQHIYDNFADGNFESIKDKETFVNTFPGAKHFNISGNFPDTSNDNIDNVVRKVIVFLLETVLFSEQFQKDIRKLITENIFNGTPVIPILQKATRQQKCWTSTEKMLQAIVHSISGFITYMKALQTTFTKRFQGRFQLHQLFGEIMSFQHLMFPSSDRSVNFFTVESFIENLEKFHFFPKTEEERLELFVQFEVFQTSIIESYRNARKQNVNISELAIIKQSYAKMQIKNHTAVCRLLDFICAMPSSEAICETWGSVIDKMSEHRQRANDGSIENNEYGTIENRIMIFLNGPPSGFKNNDKILIHALQDLYGINYMNKFYRKSTQFGKVMSKVEQQIHDRTHDPARNVASSRILPCFR